MFDEGVGKPNQLREWTVMFYFASDNPLSPGIVSQLKAVKDAGFHLDANVIARFDPHTVETPTHIFDVNLIGKLNAIKDGKTSDVGFTANDPFVRTLVPDKLWGDEPSSADAKVTIREKLVKFFEEQSITYDPPKPPKFTSEAGPRTNDTDRLTDEPGPTESLENFLEFCRKFYPARHYMLFILGHGIVVGNDIFLFDEHARGNHAVTLKNLGDKLSAFANAIQGPEAREKGQLGEFELVSFHSCSMSGVEVAYELKGSAKYMLASQGPAFVGSWPYRQILIRVFNDINRSGFRPVDLKDRRGLAAKIATEANPVCEALRSHLNKEELAVFQKVSTAETVDPDEAQIFFKSLNSCLSVPDLFKAFASVGLSRDTRSLIAQHEAQNFQDKELRRFNRRLLMETFTDELDMIRGMASSIFDYCLYNSYDFQLAGYSFDLCLTDLRKLNERQNEGLKSAIEELSRALCAALPEPTGQLAEEVQAKAAARKLTEEERVALDLILLAHWQSQSYYEENYTDIFDFCFCLQQRCVGIQPLLPEKISQKLTSLSDACEKVMRMFDISRDSLIVRSDFAGPTYQYSHGLSIFFPWSAPVANDMWTNQYNEYALMKDSTQSWKKFLDAYFEASLRKTQEEERSIAHMPVKPSNPDADLLEEMGRLVFNEFGQLKDDSHDRTDKDNKHDPTGDDCTCPSIKNYPPFTRARKAPVSKRFFQRMFIQ